MKKFPDYSNGFGKNIIDHESDDYWSTGFLLCIPSFTGGSIYVYMRKIYFLSWYGTLAIMKN